MFWILLFIFAYAVIFWLKRAEFEFHFIMLNFWKSHKKTQIVAVLLFELPHLSGIIRTLATVYDFENTFKPKVHVSCEAESLCSGKSWPSRI